MRMLSGEDMVKGPLDRARSASPRSPSPASPSSERAFANYANPSEVALESQKSKEQLIQPTPTTMAGQPAPQTAGDDTLPKLPNTNHVMTASDFELYRTQCLVAGRNGLVDDGDDNDDASSVSIQDRTERSRTSSMAKHQASEPRIADEYDEEENEEFLRIQALKKKQSASLAVYRQKMMKVTGSHVPPMPQAITVEPSQSYEDEDDDFPPLPMQQPISRPQSYMAMYPQGQEFMTDNVYMDPPATAPVQPPRGLIGEIVREEEAKVHRRSQMNMRMMYGNRRLEQMYSSNQAMSSASSLAQPQFGHQHNSSFDGNYGYLGTSPMRPSSSMSMAAPPLVGGRITSMQPLPPASRLSAQPLVGEPMLQPPPTAQQSQLQNLMNMQMQLQMQIMENMMNNQSLQQQQQQQQLQMQQQQLQQQMQQLQMISQPPATAPPRQSGFYNMRSPSSMSLAPAMAAGATAHIIPEPGSRFVPPQAENIPPRAPQNSRPASSMSSFGAGVARQRYRGVPPPEIGELRLTDGPAGLAPPAPAFQQGSRDSPATVASYDTGDDAVDLVKTPSLVVSEPTTDEGSWESVRRRKDLLKKKWKGHIVLGSNTSVPA
ncbi:uncharacterized protein V1510DRAFT_404463 [Dipodascopsis tothii]|uniref:uncharacterized protein n=1 Tax=Dipodascopsis tothii TaxID=44089 RepID=UPI0034CDAD63